MTWRELSPTWILSAPSATLSATERSSSSAELVEIGDLEAGAVLDGPGVGWEVAEKQAEERRFPRPVRTDHTDLVAASHEGREIADDVLTGLGTAVVGEGGVFHLDHLLAGAFRLVGAELDLACLLAPGTAFLAHFLQDADAALVAGAAGLDALADPGFLLGELLVEKRRMLGLDLELFFLLAQVGVVIAGIALEATAVEVDDAGGEAAQEGAVVGDEEKRAGKAHEKLFETLDRGDVEVVRRLV